MHFIYCCGMANRFAFASQHWFDNYNTMGFFVFRCDVLLNMPIAMDLGDCNDATNKAHLRRKKIAAENYKWRSIYFLCSAFKQMLLSNKFMNTMTSNVQAVRQMVKPVLDGCTMWEEGGWPRNKINQWLPLLTYQSNVKHWPWPWLWLCE